MFYFIKYTVYKSLNCTTDNELYEVFLYFMCLSAYMYIRYKTELEICFVIH